MVSVVCDERDSQSGGGEVPGRIPTPGLRNCHSNPNVGIPTTGCPKEDQILTTPLLYLLRVIQQLQVEYVLLYGMNFKQ